MRRWAAGLLLAAATSTPAAAVAEAASPCRSEAAVLQEDANEDGQVTLLEARAAALALFEHFDRDGDGAVVRSEADLAAGSWRARRLELRFAALDKDRDGALSRSEVALHQRRFARADRDGDGLLSRPELSSAFGGKPAAVSDTAALRSMFWRRDVDRDGRVTRSESLAAADRRFMRRDRDRDGVVSAGGEGKGGR